MSICMNQSSWVLLRVPRCKDRPPKLRTFESWTQPGTHGLLRWWTSTHQCTSWFGHSWWSLPETFEANPGNLSVLGLLRSVKPTGIEEHTRVKQPPHKQLSTQHHDQVQSGSDVWVLNPCSSTPSLKLGLSIQTGRTIYHHSLSQVPNMLWVQKKFSLVHLM